MEESQFGWRGADQNGEEPVWMEERKSEQTRAHLDMKRANQNTGEPIRRKESQCQWKRGREPPFWMEERQRELD